MKTAIITGATGFLGLHLASALLSCGIEVTALYRRRSKNIGRLPDGVNVAYEVGDLPQADVFFHLAWESPSGPGRGDAPLQSKNVTLTLDMLNAAYACGAKFVGLGTVYERFAPQIIQSDGFGNSNFYILSKHFAHAISEQLAHKLGCEYVWCQICHPIGRYMKSEQIMAYAVKGFLSGDAPEFGAAKTLFDIVAVEDVAQGLVKIGQQKTPRREYYIGSGAPMLLRDYLEETRQVLESGMPLLLNLRPDDGLMLDEKWLDISPLCEDTGYSPVVSFDRAVRNVAEWVKDSEYGK